MASARRSRDGHPRARSRQGHRPTHCCVPGLTSRGPLLGPVLPYTARRGGAERLALMSDLTEVLASHGEEPKTILQPVARDRRRHGVGSHVEPAAKSRELVIAPAPHDIAAGDG